MVDMTKPLIMLALGVMALHIACATSTPTPIPTPTPVPFETTKFNVGAGQARTIAWDLQKGSFIEYKFESNLDFAFSVIGPDGNFIIRPTRLIADEGQVRADVFGRYTLKFDNGSALFASKTISVEHRAVPPGGR